MAEGSVMQLGPSVDSHTADQSGTHLSGRVGLQEEGGASQWSAYCNELLMRGGEEFSFEELRAQRYFQQRQGEMDERLKHLKEVKEQLSVELEEKRRLLLLRTSQQQVLPEAPPSQSRDSGPAAAPSFQIYDESPSAAARPAGNSELQDDVFLRPDERGLCLKVHCPRPDDRRGMPEDLQTLDSCPRSVPQKPVSKVTKNLSPIQETSVEANSLTSVDQDQDQNAPSPGPVGGALDPCDPDVRRRLLDRCDVTSSPGFHSESRPLPPVCGCLQLEGEVYRIYSRVVDGGSFSIYSGATEEDCVLIKVDSCCVPWDFHQFNRLKKSSAAASLPLISCFLFLDGCVTVYTCPPDHIFTELTECVSSDDSVCHTAVVLLQLVSQLHSCRVLHAALQPRLLTCSHRGLMCPDWVFPVDWSSSVDLDLQDVTSVQQLPSAHTYISMGLLEPTAPPQLVDLVGLAETVHLLLTNSRMVLVKDDGGWMVERFSGDDTCDMFSRMWRMFFRSLLNAGGRSSLSVLSELKEQLSTLHH
ncbi:uncharacterized protein LOC111231747 [Seriola dumerili]|uniref:Uncharacterized LOC111231747 n=1 Tax=Seriola dumerili TaxID=41447 RepID=A0A3B4UU60_SERDU|nr:uncharacterized protein LOC111231747 [Seriola dumerili]